MEGGMSNGERKVLVTGCDYGLGVELVKAALARGYMVYAGCLAPGRAKEMKELKKRHGVKLEVFGLDLASEASIKRACMGVGRKTKRLDLLINNAGIFWNDGLDKVNFADFTRMCAVNAFGPVCLIRHLRGLLRAAGEAKIINVSSESGSMGVVNGIRPIYAYGASKAALNMFTRRLAFELAGEGTRVISVHPGWMKTPMGRASGEPEQEPAQTAENIFNLAERMDNSMNGGFFIHTGERHPW